MENAGWYVLLTGAVGAIVGLWGQIRSIIDSLFSIFISRRYIDNNYHTNLVINHYFNNNKNIKRSILRIPSYTVQEGFIRPKNRFQKFFIENPWDFQGLFWLGLIPIWIYRNNSNGNSTSVNSIRFFADLDKIFIEAENMFNESKQKTLKRFDIKYICGKNKFNFNIKNKNNNESPDNEFSQPNNDNLSDNFMSCKILQWHFDDIGKKKTMNGRPLEMIAMSKEMEKTFNDISFWSKNENWYTDHNIPWRIGTLLVGPPGTGKTTYVRTIAEELDIPISCLDLSEMSNEELYEVWQKEAASVPRIMLIEDIDSIFDGRENVAKQGKLSSGVTFDCLLNCIDGVSKMDGIILMITTNNIGKIDEALAKPSNTNNMSRPGRIDMVLTFGPPDKDGLIKICKRILSEYPEELDRIVGEGLANNDTGAQFQHRCQEVAKKALEQIIWTDLNMGISSMKKP